MSEVAVAAGLARVVHVLRADEVVINKGVQDGIKVGDSFLVYGIGPNLTDPDSGKPLGNLELVRGRGEAVHVQDHMAVIRSIERPWRGGDAFQFMLPGDGPTLPFRGAEAGDLAKPV
jgi:hypothetical protein